MLLRTAKYIDSIVHTHIQCYCMCVSVTRILATSAIAFLYLKPFVDFNNEKVMYTNSLFQIAVICKMEIFAMILYVYLYAVISLAAVTKLGLQDFIVAQSYIFLVK